MRDKSGANTIGWESAKRPIIYFILNPNIRSCGSLPVNAALPYSLKAP
jgi:hypothetical protein